MSINEISYTICLDPNFHVFLRVSVPPVVKIVLRHGVVVPNVLGRSPLCATLIFSRSGRAHVLRI